MSDSIINQLASMHIDAQIQAEDNFFLDRVISNDLLGDLIFGFSSAGSLLRFSRTCKTCLVIIKSYIARAFNINRHLSRFFPDPIAFRSLQAWTGTLVSGSNALQFFDRSFYPESDLDIYVPGRYKAEVGRWLLSAGYEFKPNSVQRSDFETAVYHPMTEGPDGSYNMKGVSAVFTFKKTSPSNSEEVLQVQAIIARHTPMDAILLFHSSRCNGPYQFLLH